MATCNDCVHLDGYMTGDDEYPQRTHICWCNKGHWENGDLELLYDEIECPDFKGEPDVDKIWDIESQEEE